MNSQGVNPMGPEGHDRLDELQRGQERSPSVEALERRPVFNYGGLGQREAPIPDPGERPGAVRIDDAAEDESAGRQPPEEGAEA